MMRRFLALLAIVALASGCGKEKNPRAATAVTLPAPDTFHVALQTSKGRIVIEVVRPWAPHGADRFMELTQTGFFDEDRFFRVVPEFIAQWGVNDNKKTNEYWDEKPIPDDSVRASNARGTVTYASLGPGTRAHQLFINLEDNKQLDKKGFAPIGRVVEGMAVVDSLYSGYSEQVSQHLISTLGNKYLDRMFPKLDYIVRADVVKR